MSTEPGHAWRTHQRGRGRSKCAVHPYRGHGGRWGKGTSSYNERLCRPRPPRQTRALRLRVQRVSARDFAHTWGHLFLSEGEDQGLYLPVPKTVAGLGLMVPESRLIYPLRAVWPQENPFLFPNLTILI